MRTQLDTRYAIYLVIITGLVWGTSEAAQELPNILIVYADDLGYGDLSTYNSEAAYQTPRLDQMADEGIKFLDAHSPCTICSPSRFGLFAGEIVCRTGRKPTAFEGPSGPSYLAPGKLTLAAMLQYLQVSVHFEINLP